jgi:hypothetical protein
MEWMDTGSALRNIAGGNAGCITDEAGAAMASALRHAAERRCPSTPGALIRDARTSLAGLVAENLGDRWEAALQELVGLGDLSEGDQVGVVEDPDAEATRGRRLYAHPSALVEAAGRALLVGVDVGPDRRDWGAVGARLHRRGALRLLEPAEGPEVAFARRLARDAGLPLLDASGWARAPAPTSASMLVGRFRRLLAASPPFRGSLQGLRVVCRARGYRPVTAEDSPSDFREYVASTQGTWGSRPWCFVQLDTRSRVEGLVELPQERGLPAFAEAWRLALALAAERGEPGVWRYEGPRLMLSFPAPPWVARQLDLLGERARAWPTAWLLAPKHRPHAERLLQEQLWMTPEEPSVSPSWM